MSIGSTKNTTQGFIQELERKHPPLVEGRTWNLHTSQHLNELGLHSSFITETSLTILCANKGQSKLVGDTEEGATVTITDSWISNVDLSKLMKIEVLHIER